MPRSRAESVVVAVTGATGAVYARRLLEVILPQVPAVHLTMSVHGQQVLNYELGLDLSLKRFDPVALLGYAPENLTFWHPSDMNAPFASGSSVADAMVVVPCSMSKVSVIAHGYSEDLIARAADVTLKERRLLILAPRESPFNLTHLRNLVAVTEAGALVMPAMPAFYQLPRSMEDLIDSVVYRIVDHLGLDVPDSVKWTGEIR
ncbi:MAG TPA: UbiX family flavin prenyltransferase [Armatimonadota bacterium]|jgi:4-hydroxy-3-polyprenylbenzoate decarboxylase